METIYHNIHQLIWEVAKYNIHSKEALQTKDYKRICKDARSLLDLLETGFIPEKDFKEGRENNEDVRNFIDCLNALREQEDNLKRKVIAKNYYKSKKYADGFMIFLFTKMKEYK
ncbi:hypothetical protein A3K74_01870 [Candidatus Pacearchaeota archaeon RBG_13_33_26]|nr:MAG: hypothetical protein A3K74_01870 [Candidatus Pacearchaeota archaeon RBG_13_33_26]